MITGTIKSQIGRIWDAPLSDGILKVPRVTRRE
jgi:hypothetical protein